MEYKTIYQFRRLNIYNYIFDYPQCNSSEKMTIKRHHPNKKIFQYASILLVLR